CLQGYKTPLTF
nr:immunoglobulin light chain junction region [Macaca mulatta]MOV34691.1 immunoglobulin light chain junction region [Macaca mulatta]